MTELTPPDHADLPTVVLCTREGSFARRWIVGHSAERPSAALPFGHRIRIE